MAVQGQLTVGQLLSHQAGLTKGAALGEMLGADGFERTLLTLAGANPCRLISVGCSW